MLTPEQQAQHTALLLKQYKGTLTAEERADLEALELLRAAPEAVTGVTALTDFVPDLNRLADELDRLDADLGELAGKIGGRSAHAEAMETLARHDAEKKRQGNGDAH